MDKLIRNNIRNIDEYHEATWDTRDMPNKEDITHKSIKRSLLAVIQEEVEDNLGSNYRTTTPKECIDLLETLEAKYGRRRTYRESWNPKGKNKKAVKPDGNDDKSESVPRVPRKKLKPKPRKVKQ